MFNRVYYTIRQSFKNIKQKQNHNRIQYKRRYSVPPNKPQDMMKNWIYVAIVYSFYLYYTKP